MAAEKMYLLPMWTNSGVKKIEVDSNKKENLRLIDLHKKRIKLIHVAKSQVKLDDESYRDILSGYGVESSKDLTLDQQVLVIQTMGKLGFKQKSKPSKYNELSDKRIGNTKLATPRQLRMVEGMWRGSMKVRNKSDEALRMFVKRITGVDKLEWVPVWDVKKVVKAIEELA